MNPCILTLPCSYFLQRAQNREWFNVYSRACYYDCNKYFRDWILLLVWAFICDLINFFLPYLFLICVLTSTSNIQWKTNHNETLILHDPSWAEMRGPYITIIDLLLFNYLGVLWTARILGLCVKRFMHSQCCYLTVCFLEKKCYFLLRLF